MGWHLWWKYHTHAGHAYLRNLVGATIFPDMDMMQLPLDNMWQLKNEETAKFLLTWITTVLTRGYYLLLHSLQIWVSVGLTCTLSQLDRLSVNQRLKFATSVWLTTQLWEQGFRQRGYLPVDKPTTGCSSVVCGLFARGFSLFCLLFDWLVCILGERGARGDRGIMLLPSTWSCPSTST